MRRKPAWHRRPSCSSPTSPRDFTSPTSGFSSINCANGSDSRGRPSAFTCGPAGELGVQRVQEVQRVHELQGVHGVLPGVQNLQKLRDAVYTGHGDPKLYKAGEVCELLQVQLYVLRSWEKEFPGIGVQGIARQPATVPAKRRRARSENQAARFRRRADGIGCTPQARGVGTREFGRLRIRSRRSARCARRRCEGTHRRGTRRTSRAPVAAV
jgi:hypothetical protein